MLIDTHCHLTFEGLAQQSEDVLRRAREAGVGRVVTVATTPADARAALGLMLNDDSIHLAAGIHPHEAGNCTREDLEALAALHRGQWSTTVPASRVVAVGETGLDLHYDFAPLDRQEEVFRLQLELACEVERPVVIHAREAELRACDILREYAAIDRVVFHCYSADATIARRILDLGFWISFTGLVTFKTAEPVRAAARLVPDDRIMVETDSPYLSPDPVRKVRPCEPAFVAHTARFLADLRHVTFEAFAETTTANAARFFNLSEDCS